MDVSKFRAHMRLFIAIAIAVAMLIGFGSVGTAQADQIVPTYKGWGYAKWPDGVAGPLTAVPAWKWTTAGWQRASFPFGASGWLHPFGSGWHWYYRGGEWYALKSTAVNPWNCSEFALLSIPSEMRIPVRRYNAHQSELYGYVGQGSYTTKCIQSFPDAGENPTLLRCMAIGCGPDVFWLAEVTPMPGCTIPMNDEPICMIAMPIGGFPKKTAYLQISELQMQHIGLAMP